MCVLWSDGQVSVSALLVCCVRGRVCVCMRVCECMSVCSVVRWTGLGLSAARVLCSWAVSCDARVWSRLLDCGGIRDFRGLMETDGLPAVD